MISKIIPKIIRKLKLTGYIKWNGNFLKLEEILNTFPLSIRVDKLSPNGTLELQEQTYVIRSTEAHTYPIPISEDTFNLEREFRLQRKYIMEKLMRLKER